MENVSVALDGAAVLESVSAQVDKGGWLGVVGPNGAGKTTLLRAVAGLVSFEGRIEIAGHVPNLSKRRQVARLVSYVPQRPVIPLAMSVVDYVMLGRSAHHSYLGPPSRRDRRVVAAVLQRLDLTALANRALCQISGGECQRVVLARALAQEAPVLVMDEPTASLDLGHGQLVLELADELRRERSLSVLCALHDLTFAAQYSDQLLVLSGGRTVACGSAREVLTQESVEAVFEACVEITDAKSGIAITPVRPGQQAAAPVALRRLQA
jgi:iron complex transport system ATP-binding protein